MAIKPEIKDAAAKVSIAGAGGAGVGAMGGGIIANMVEPLKTVFTPDTSWHINNNDGTTSYTMIGHTLNQAAHDAAMRGSVTTGATLLGLAAAGMAAHHIYKNRNLGRQFK